MEIQNVTYDNQHLLTADDIEYRAAKFAANKLGFSVDEVLESIDLMEAAVKLFWDAYIADEVEL